MESLEIYTTLIARLKKDVKSDAEKFKESLDNASEYAIQIAERIRIAPPIRLLTAEEEELEIRQTLPDSHKYVFSIDTPKDIRILYKENCDIDAEVSLCNSVTESEYLEMMLARKASILDLIDVRTDEFLRLQPVAEELRGLANVELYISTNLYVWMISKGHKR